jgi:hypothetical protein
MASKHDFDAALRWGNGDRCVLPPGLSAPMPRYQLVYKIRHALKKQGKLLRIPRTAFNAHGIHIVDERSLQLMEVHVNLESLAESLNIISR